MLDTGSYVQYHLLLLLSRNPPLSNFRIVSEQGRTKDLKTQNWQLYKSPERASAVSTNIWGDQPSRRSGSGFIMFGSEAWVPVTSLGACDQSVCLEEYQLPVELDTKICLSFSCSSSVQHQESLGLFGLIVHGTACLPVYTGTTTYAYFAERVIIQSQNAQQHLQKDKWPLYPPKHPRRHRPPKNQQDPQDLQSLAS